MNAAKEAYLLDTSAVLTLIEDESGAERVEKILRNERSLIAFVTLLEVRYITLQERDEATADSRHTLLLNSGATILWQIDEPALLTAARMKASYRVSLADALIAAFASRYTATLVHKDPEFEALAGELRLESLPLKQRGR